MVQTAIVQKLVDKLDDEPRMKEALQDSFSLAYATGIKEFAEYKITSLDDYIDYMDKFVHWVPTEDSTGKNIYFHMCMFYFVIDMPPIREWQNPIQPGQKSPWMWLFQWLIDYSKAVGEWMDSPASISPTSIKSFYEAPNYHMDDYPGPQSEWTTFNKFFARKIDPAKRPIAELTNDKVIVQPADSVFDGAWAVNDTDVPDVTTFDVKGLPWTISQLLDDPANGAQYAHHFAGGMFTHSFLSPADYHRQHAPVAGKVIVAKVIPGLCYLEVILRKLSDGGVTLAAEHPQMVFHDRPGYQFLQARALILIENELLGLVAVLPIGMAQVSSVKLSVKQNDTVTKGQEISYFQLGGSDVVMVFQDKANVRFHQNRGVPYKFGEKAATGGS
jgi:phosphatidylserine decarboxylase